MMHARMPDWVIQAGMARSDGADFLMADFLKPDILIAL